MNQWKLKTNTNERKCSICGADHKTCCILEIEPEHFKCTSCILKQSKDEIERDPLSGTFSFTDGTMSFNEYNNLLDNAEIELEDLDETH